MNWKSHGWYMERIERIMKGYKFGEIHYIHIQYSQIIRVTDASVKCFHDTKCQRNLEH